MDDLKDDYLPGNLGIPTPPSVPTRTRHRRHQPFAAYLLYGLLSLVLTGSALRVFGYFPNDNLSQWAFTKKNAGFDWEQLVPNSELRWEPCNINRECAKLEVPLDYNDPTGDKATIALLRVKAKVSPKSKNYRGPILFNPGESGGPGGSGVRLIDGLGDHFQKMLGDDFDIVGFDPRGIGLTEPQVSIFSDAYERAYWELGQQPLANSTHDSLARGYARADLFGDLAVARSKRAAQYVSTASVARDMLSITRAHGRERLLYWGFSYGTVLGSTYAAMFPDNIERLAIDGVVEMDDYYSGRWYSNLHDTDNIIQYFYDKCAAAGAACPLSANTSALVEERVENIFASIKASPLPVFESPTSYGVVDYSLLKNGLFQSLYAPFPLLSQFAYILAEVEKGNGRPALEYAESIKNQPKCGVPAIIPITRTEAGAAVMCGEGLGAGRDYNDVEVHLRKLRGLSVFADVWTDIARIPCSGWKIEVKDRYAGPFNTTTSFPLLVIGNTGDPVTPLRGAKMIAEGFNAALLTINTPGHCSLAGTSLSATKHIRRYFREGIVPPEGTVCEIENKLFGNKSEADEVLIMEDQELLDITRKLGHEFRSMRRGFLL
ncbi:hypothetical protein K439DRAFT_1418020 [Ramaria rubella]|nr:hypothetical protein K439DRAFT_1418020 [Ramaria rubella]